GFAAAGFGAGLAAGLGAGFATPSASSRCFRRRATGGAIEEDADLTYSPISLSFSRATLDSMPSSAAISCTRGLATILLSGSAPDRSGRYRWRGLISSRSLLVHVPFSLFFRDWIEVRQPAHVERGFLAECSPEGASPDRRGDASGIRVDPGAAPREACRGVHHGPSVTRDDPHKCGSRCALPATQAGSDGVHPTPPPPPRPTSVPWRGWSRARSAGETTPAGRS